MNINNYKASDWSMRLYLVIGKNPQTNRKKQNKIAALSFDEDFISKRSGLCEIKSISLLSLEAPSKEQIDYAADLGVPFNPELSKQDYSSIISKILREESPESVSKDIARFAERFNVFLSSYVSIERAYNYIYHEMPLLDKITFFAFSVYQKMRGFICYDFMNHPELELFKKYADLHIEDSKFIKSLECYFGADLIPGKSIKNSFAYQDCKKFF